MNAQQKKILVFVSFFIIFLGAAAFMYFKYVHNKPRGKWTPRTEVDPVRFDSMLKEKHKRK